MMHAHRVRQWTWALAFASAGSLVGSNVCAADGSSGEAALVDDVEADNIGGDAAETWGILGDNAALLCCGIGPLPASRRILLVLSHGAALAFFVTATGLLSWALLSGSGGLVGVPFASLIIGGAAVASGLNVVFFGYLFTSQSAGWVISAMMGLMPSEDDGEATPSGAAGDGNSDEPTGAASTPAYSEVAMLF